MAIIPHPQADYFVVTDKTNGVTYYADFNINNGIDTSSPVSGCFWRSDLRQASCFDSVGLAIDAIVARNLPKHLTEVVEEVTPSIPRP